MKEHHDHVWLFSGTAALLKRTAPKGPHKETPGVHSANATLSYSDSPLMYIYLYNYGDKLYMNKIGFLHGLENKILLWQNNSPQPVHDPATKCYNQIQGDIKIP